MKKLLILVFLLTISSSQSYAFWVWTPETNEWVNPKFSVKDTPREQLDYALESYQAKDYKKTLVELEKLIKNYPRAKEAADAQFYIALCYEEQGDLFKAFKSYQTVVEKYPFSERSSQIVEKQYRIGERFLEGEGQQNKFVRALVGSDYNVIEVFRTVIKNAPYGPYAAPAQYKIGLYLLEKGLYQEARDEFEKVMNDYSDSQWVKAAKYQMAIADAHRSVDSQYDQKVTQAAVKEFKEFVDVYPDAELSEKARKKIHELREKEAENNFLIARFYEKKKELEAAKLYYHTVINDYQDTSIAVKALENLRALELGKK
ncbi:MAG: outer membrane protein assembly factor BamD [Candidatus Omnitrophota bacterium]